MALKINTAFGRIVVYPGESLDEAKTRSWQAWAQGLDPLRRPKPKANNHSVHILSA